MRSRRIRTIGFVALGIVVPMAVASCSQSNDSKAASSAPVRTADGGKPGGNTSGGGATSAASSRGVDLAVAKRAASDRQRLASVGRAHLPL